MSAGLRVLVTGAGGFVGRVLSQRLLNDGLGGQRVGHLVMSDLVLNELPQDSRVRAIEGSIADAGVLECALDAPVDAVFHLASVPGGAAERDPDLGRRVNLDATQQLIELGALSHFLTVFLASPVRLQISPSESWSRNFMRRTLPIMSMVITYYIPAESFSRAVEHPCQFSIGTRPFRLSNFGRRQQSSTFESSVLVAAMRSPTHMK